MSRLCRPLCILALLVAGCGHGGHHSGGGHSGGHSSGHSSSHTSHASHSGGGGSGCGNACGILADVLVCAIDSSEVAVDVAEAEREREAASLPPLPPPLPPVAPTELKSAMQAAVEMLSASDYPQFLARSVEPGPEVTAATEQSLRDGLGAQLLSATAACSQRGPEMSADGNAARCTGPDGNALWWVWTQNGWVMVLHAP